MAGGDRVSAAWTASVLTDCIALRPGERLLVLVDEPLRHAGAALCAAAADMAAGAKLREVDSGRRPFQVIPGDLVTAVAAADAVVSLLSRIELNRPHSPLQAAVAAFRSSGQGRWATAHYVDQHMLDHEIAVDYAAVERVAAGLAARLRQADRMRLVTDAGTDLSFRIGSRPVHVESGRLRSPGSIGNLPAGETFVAPLEGSAEGRLVVDLSLGDLEIEQPVTLTFHAGEVIAIDGGEAAAILAQRLSGDPARRALGEFGLGANPWLRPRGRVTVDEKVLGTAHIAVGANQSFGGENPADTHYDCVIKQPLVYADGNLIELRA